MPFSNIVQPDARGMLHRVFEAHCASFGIHSEDGRRSGAMSLVHLYQNGVTNETELATMVEMEDRAVMQTSTGPSPSRTF